MLNKITFLLLLTGMLFACENAPKEEAADSEAQETSAAETETTEAQENEVFGEAFTPQEALSYLALQEKMQSIDSVEVQFTGTVQEVCQAKGCWMTIAEQANSEDTPVMVKFKDYGFFMPKDIAGRKVVMNGYAFREVTSVDELRHYAEDAGKSKEEIEAITEPKEELKFLASGVVLLEE